MIIRLMDGSLATAGVKSGLLHFRASLVESQRSILLRQLDQKIQELEKAHRRPNRIEQ